MFRLLGLLWALLCIWPSFRASAQIDFNLEFVSNLNYQQNCNDIWAWVADDGTEYAILGTVTGTAIISLADPSNPVEVQFIPGSNSLWRDMKHWGNFVYVTADVGSDGLLVIDMAGAPENITWEFWRPLIEANNTVDTLRRCHNLYIDENGYAYLAGCNINGGGPLIIDVHSEPGKPEYLGASDRRYSHDVYVRNNLMYSSDINDGFFSVIDVSDKRNPVTLATQETSFRFTHNAWLSDNSQFVFTTDERPNAFIDAYDVSDVNNIFLTDRYRPLGSEGNGVIPHNVHVIDDYLVISYYTDGVKVVDASDPYNLIEVGSYDTYPLPPGGFNGCWGAYPWLPSGLILASDINTGLYVLRPTYKRASRLEGTVTDAQTGAPLNNVSIQIISELVARSETRNDGTYKTGVGLSGNFTVIYERVGYITQEVELNFENGETITQDISLQPIPRFALSGEVVDKNTGLPVTAQIEFRSELIRENTVADSDGLFSVSVIEGNYELVVGAWGYLYHTESFNGFSENQSLRVELEPGFADDFVFDFGWEVTGDALIGHWERGVPEATFLNGIPANPGNAFPQAIGDKCYVTGLAGGGVGDFDLDDGFTILTSPEMDLSNYENPKLQYARWFFNAGGFGPIDDTLVVYAINSQQEIVLEKVWGTTNGWSLSPEFMLADFIDISEPIRIVFEASDLPGTGHIVEAAIDFFSISGEITSSIPENRLSESLKVFPNPSQGGNNLIMDLSQLNYQGEARWQLIDMNGSIQMSQDILVTPSHLQIMPRHLNPGVYIVRLELANGLVYQNKWVVF